MSDTVLDEKITAYSRSPNDPYDDILVHHGVKGQNWYQHKFGNWERHAKYANGQPNPETMPDPDSIKAPMSNEAVKKRIYGGTSTSERRAARQEKKAAKKAKRAAQKKAMEEKWLGKEGEKPRSNITDLTSDEIKEMTNRLKIENDYLSALKNAKTLDRDLYKMTSSEGLLDTLQYNLKKTGASAGKKLGQYALYKTLVSLVGEEDAKLLTGVKTGDKKKGNNNNNNNNKDNKDKKSPYAEEIDKLDAERQKKKAREDYYRRYPEERSQGGGNRNNQPQYAGPKRVISTVRRKQTPKASKKR